MELLQLLGQLWALFVALLALLSQFVWLALQWSLLLLWLAWWLGAVNWRKAWGVLAQGAWAPVVLFVLMGALVWSQIAPADLYLFGGNAPIPNFWWQLGGVTLLLLSALFCGWLQGVFGWTPPEIDFDPAPGAGHG